VLARRRQGFQPDRGPQHGDPDGGGEHDPATHTGEATSVNTIVRTIGGSIGSAVVAAVITSDSTAQGLPNDNAFWVCAGVALLAILAALALPSRASR
jgi:hypothetical protein